MAGSNVKMSGQWEIKVCYRGSKMQDLIQNLQQNHSPFCDIINMCTINLFAFTNLVPRVSWLSEREGHLSSYQKASMPWEWGCTFSYSMKIELLANISFMLNKKVKNRWIKKTKKNKEKVRSSMKLPSIYPFRESLHHCPIHGERQRSESHRNGVPWSF